MILAAIIADSDLMQLSERLISFVFAVLVGSGVKLGYKAQTTKISFRYVFFVVACAMLVGYWIDVYATSKGWIEMRGAMVSAGALISESLISYFFKNDNSIWDDLKSVFIKRLGGKNNDSNNDI
jgi:hypothetical protein